MNLFSMWRLKSDNAGTFFRVGLTLQVIVVAGLLTVVASGNAALATVVPFIVLAVSTLGLVGPAGSSRYMGFFGELAGSASSVYTTHDVLLGRNVRLVERCAQRRHAAADRGHDARARP